MEEKEIIYQSKKIKCVVERKRIKNIYICIKPGQVVLKAPFRVKDEEINRILEQRKRWIYEKTQEQNLKIDRSINLKKNNYIYMFGEKIDVVYEFTYVSSIKVNIDKKCEVIVPLKFMLCSDTISKVEEAIEKEQKKILYNEVGIIMEKYRNLTGLYPEKYSIRKLKRIWGNCSSKKEIKINQNLVWYDKKELEYVCLHEITHLKYMNHKKEFWNFVEKYMPDYKESVKRLQM